MLNRVPPPFRSLVLAAGLTLPLSAQDPVPVPVAPPLSAAVAKVEEPGFIVRRYPRDKDVPVAVVAGRPITLGEVVLHIEERHHPGFEQALRVRPEIQRMLQSDLVAPWVRHYADLAALKHLTREAGIESAKLEQKQAAQLKAMFESWLGVYTEQRKAAGQSTELSQQLVNRLLADFQLRSGITAELQGFLDLLESDEYTRGQLQDFFQAFPRYFGGTVSLAHILIHNRDPGTGILLNDAGMAKAAALLADVRARLRPDGSNFEEVARLCSADTKTAGEGGLIGDVHRFDDRLPAPLCRAAWSMRDGEVSDVVESPYGWHILKRIDYDQRVYFLFTDDAMPVIRTITQRARQEDLLFRARELAKVKLLL